MPASELLPEQAFLLLSSCFVYETFAIVGLEGISVIFAIFRMRMYVSSVTN